MVPCHHAYGRVGVRRLLSVKAGGIRAWAALVGVASQIMTLRIAPVGAGGSWPCRLALDHGLSQMQGYGPVVP